MNTDMNINILKKTNKFIKFQSEVKSNTRNKWVYWYKVIITFDIASVS